ncbi:transglycosylase SLT domain-containing protein [Priestia megaterium]|uniref:transglycosylase SLT domain-containing protein n=1 Tax=Priestia megaterium TaxID=1404 RepID=UPI002E23C2E2|nr:transglycosylase SLT domain-containing protein [Priestia megaterium]MED4102193.1 transglycosylase SLT domain-containing protein [Priestia megaterium]MED4142620.1 transglycosylase SLT domain-containing protein [Priestia megaterium]
MAETGGSNINITATDRQARRTIASFFRSVEAQARRFSRVMGDNNPVNDMADSFDDLGDHLGDTFDEMGDRTRGYYDEWGRYHRRTTDTIGKEIRNLPEHLKPFHQSLDDTRKHLRNLDRATVSFEEMSEAAVKTGTSIKKSLSVSSSGKSAIKTINALNSSVKETQLAILGLNRDGTVKISTEQTQERLHEFRREIDKTKQDLERLRDAGDFASYEAGMEVVEKKLRDVDRAMRVAARGGQAYTNMVTELGVNTPDAMNRAAIAMEAYKDTWIRSIQIMEARKGQAQKMLDILPQTSSIQRIDAFFLGIGNNLEKMAKQSTAASIALRQLGPNASMKDLQDRVMVITQGIMRMQMVAIAAGIAVAGFTAAMFNAAKGPSPADVLADQQKALAEYQTAVQERTTEILRTWAYFGKAEVEATKPKDIIKNFQSQVNTLRKYNDDMAALSKKLPATMIDELRKMGPEVAGTIHNMRGMSDTELQKVVSLWRQRHAEAREAAVTELQALKQATDQKIKDLQNSLTPLGISLARAQGVWAQALGPFVDIWGRVAAKILDVATALGTFINKMNQANDDISQMTGMFLYLATVFGLLLSPMAIGIGNAAGFAAAFGSIWMIAGPLILGLTRIAGIVSVLSGAIVIVVGTIMKMWRASENLRNSVSSLGTVLKIGFQQNIARIQPAINQLKAAMDRLLASIFGSSKAGDIFKRMGDVIARAITWLTQNVLPIFMTVMRNAFNVAGQAISGIAAFISKIAPKVGEMVRSIATFVKVLVDTVTNGNTVIGKIFQVTWTVISFILKSAWQNIKAIITSGIAIITNIFQLFTNLLQGNWKAAFGNLVAIVKNVIILIWNYINLMMLGRILGVFRSFFAGAITLFKSGWSKIHFNVSYFILRIQEIITKTYTRITTATGNAFKSMLSWARSILGQMYNFIKSNFMNTYNFYVNIMRRIYIAFRGGWAGVKSLTLTFLKNVWGFIQTYFKLIYSYYVRILLRIYQIFNSRWRDVYNLTVKIFQSVYKFLSNIFSSIYKTISGAVTKTRQWVSNGWNALWSQTKTIFGNIKKSITKTYDDIVSGAKKLPGRIGQGIKNMASGVKGGAIALANTLAKALGTGINGAISGLNWVLGKIGVEKDIPKWKVPHYKAGTDSHPGGWFVAGDGGQEELIRFPDGRMALSPATDTLYHGEKGTEVLDGKNTKRLRDSGLLPFYDSGVGKALKKKAAALLEDAKGVASKAKNKVVDTGKKVGSKAKDLALDVWSYLEKPGDLMKKVFANYIPSLPKINGAFGDILKGSVKKVKDNAVDFVKSKMAEFMPSFDDDGDSTKIGPGSGKGGMHKYVEYWYNQVKDRFGKTKFMGAYNNRNVRGGSSKSMHAYGRAFDISGSAATMAKIAEWARTHMNNLQYAIYNRKIAGPGMGKPWRHYSGQNPHYDHVHLDFKAQSGGGGSIGKAGTGVKRWAGIAAQALRMTGQYTKSNLDRLLYQMQTESTGNPKAINLWDSNARRGTPSKGLLQVIGPTFKKFAMPGHNKDIYDPLSNILASIRYSMSRYGSLANAYKGHGYKFGGIIDSPEIAALAENGKPEAVVPLVGRRMDPFAIGVAEKLGEIFNLGGTAQGNGSPYIFQVNLNGRKVAEEVFRDIDELQKRSETRSKRARGELDF